MPRGPALALLLASIVSGCGGAHSDDAPVRALMQRYLDAMVRHDWVRACDQLTPEAAQRRHLSAPSVDCPSAEAFEAGEGATNPLVHPERAGEELAALRIERVEMRGDSAQIFVRQPPFEEFILLAVRRGGRWLLAQDLEVSIPITDPGGTWAGRMPR